MPEKPAEKKSSLVRRVIGIAIFALLLLALVLMFKRPQPVAAKLSPQERTAKQQSFEQKVAELSQSEASADAPSEIHFTADEIQAAIVQSTGEAVSSAGAPAQIPAEESTRPAAPSGAAPEASLSTQEAPLVNFEDDFVRGQFPAEVGGQKVIVTVAGHLGAKDGYVTFDPTEFKVGGLTVPVALVNDQLQKKMMEQRDRLKLPDSISDIRVENGQLVVKRK